MQFSSTAVHLLLLESGVIFPRCQEFVSIYALYVCIMERVFMSEFCKTFWHFSHPQRYPGHWRQELDIENIEQVMVIEMVRWNCMADDVPVSMI